MRCAIGILFTLAVLPFLAAQTPSKVDNAPSVSNLLPRDIPSETVQITHFMTGPFGGYGSYIEPKPDLSSYQINALAEGQAATAIKILVYATGCDFKTFDLSLSQGLHRNERFVCAPLPKVSLSGQVPSELMEGGNRELVITYMAYWANEFFGILDGMVPEFHIATILPDNNGTFQGELPDLSAGTTMSSFRSGAELCFTLRDSKKWNPIALNLAPELAGIQFEGRCLKIQSSYLGKLRFVPDPK